MTDRKVGSLLEEIQGLSPKKDPLRVLEVRGANAFSSVIKLFDYIQKEFDEETANDLVKRFLNAAKTNDYRKFQRGLNKVKKLEREI
jgi:hypothetical protein